MRRENKFSEVSRREISFNENVFSKPGDKEAKVFKDAEKC